MEPKKTRSDIRTDTGDVCIGLSGAADRVIVRKIHPGLVRVGILLTAVNTFLSLFFSRHFFKFLSARGFHFLLI